MSNGVFVFVILVFLRGSFVERVDRAITDSEGLFQELTVYIGILGAEGGVHKD
jgi:hypothetical protein